MSSARSRRLRGSLGDSWGDAAYESSEDASLQSTSDAGSDMLSESDLEEDLDATPVPARVRIASTTKARQSEESKTPVKLGPSRTLRTNASAEPSFIMPSLADSPSSSLRSTTMRTPTMRIRPRQRQPRPHMNGTVRSQTESRRSSARIPSTHRHELPSNPDSPSYIPKAYQHVIWPILRYLGGIVGSAMGYLQPLFGLGLAVLLVATIIGNASIFLRHSFQKALSPVCLVPFSSYVVPFCSHLDREPRNGTREADLEEVMKIQTGFQEILSQSQDAYKLPWMMTDTRAAMRDLKGVIKYSRLPSKNLLVVEFDYFDEVARQASYDLQSYNSEVGATVDRIIYSNEYTKQVLEGLRANDEATGALERFLASMNPLNAFRPPRSLHQAVFEEYLRQVDDMKKKVDALIKSGENVSALFDTLEKELGTIRDIAARDDSKVSRNHDELLAQLYTRLGGNAMTRKDLQRQLDLLKSVRQQNNLAFKHVAGVLLKLRAISRSLDDLRDTIAEPLAVGYKTEIPLERYLDLVEQSTRRLQEVRGDDKRAQNDALPKEAPTDKSLPGGREEPSVYAKKNGVRR